MFGKNKNYDAILTNVKRVHGLEHDATEAEIDAHLQECESYEDLQTALETAAAETQKDKTAAIQKERDDFEQKCKDAEAEAERITKESAELKAQAEKLDTDLKAANAKIEKLEKEGAAQHTDGPTGEPEKPSKTKERAYDKDPITQKARKISAR